MRSKHGPAILLAVASLWWSPPTAAGEPRRSDHGDLILLDLYGSYREMGAQAADLLGDDVYHEERWSWGLDGTERAMQFYVLDDETIWGATARILTGFLARILAVEVTVVEEPLGPQVGATVEAEILPIRGPSQGRGGDEGEVVDLLRLFGGTGNVVAVLGTQGDPRYQPDIPRRVAGRDEQEEDEERAAGEPAASHTAGAMRNGNRWHGHDHHHHPRGGEAGDDDAGHTGRYGAYPGAGSLAGALAQELLG